MKKIDLLKDKLLFLKSHNCSKEEIAEVEKKIEQSKRGRRSKSKGSTYERTVAKIIMDRFPVLDLVRTPSSGGFQKSSNNTSLRGDVSNVNEEVEFLLHIEAKNQKTLKLKDWLKQSQEDCPAGKIACVTFHLQQEIKEGKVTQKADDFICLRLSDFLKAVDEESLIKKNEVKPKKILKKVGK